MQLGMNRENSDVVRSIGCSVLALLLAASIPAVWLFANRNAPRPGYGASAFLGRPPGARLDVDRYGDARYGGTAPERVTVTQLQQEVDYSVPKVPILGPPHRVD